MPRVTKSYLVFLAIIGAMGVRVHASAGDKPKHVIHIMADGRSNLIPCVFPWLDG